MFDLLRANPDHPFHAYATAHDHVQEAKAFADRTREQLLARHRGQVRAITWTMSSEDDGVTLVATIVLLLAGGRRLAFGNTVYLNQLDSDDWRGVSLEGRPFVDRIHARAEAEDLEWRAATRAELAHVLGIPADQVEGFCWLAHHLAYDRGLAGDGELYLTPSTTMDESHDH